MSGNGRRQPVRSARTATTRPANYYAKLSYPSRHEAEEPEQTEPHGFFPAITYFTDAVAALPRETIRHFTMLKETEGKAYQPDLMIGDLIDKINTLPEPPRRTIRPHIQAVLGFPVTNSMNGSAPSSVVDGSIPATQLLDNDAAEQPIVPDELGARRSEYWEALRNTTKHMNPILDEKIMVLNAANETLSRQLARLENVLPYVEKEVSEEARLGSTTHWALAHMKAARRGAPAHGSRRDAQGANSLVAAAHALHETDIAAVRSEARREAMRAQRRANVDSDFDERPASKRPHASSKNKRTQEAVAAEGKAGANGQAKRRRVDKPVAIPAERSLGAALNGRLAGPAPGLPGKKPKSANAPAAKRRNFGDTASIASSPTRGTFSTKPTKDQSPRPTAARNRQNSGMSVKAQQPSQRPASSASHNRGVHVGTPELRTVAQTTGRTVGEAASAMKDAYISTEGAQVMEQEGVNGALVIEGNADWKREETEPADEQGMAAGPPESVNIFRNPTPLEAEAAQMSRSRSTRGVNNKQAASSPALASAQPARSHHKASRQVKPRPSAAADVSSDEEGNASRQGSEHGDDARSTAGSDDDEPVYCICQQPSYGSMVACDNPNCRWEWFHLECVGLTQEPSGSTKWYCNDCKKTQKRGRNGASGNGR